MSHVLDPPRLPPHDARSAKLSSVTAQPAAAPTPTASPAAITLAWLVRLRWGAVLGQSATIAVALVALDLALPIAPLVGLVAGTIASNAWLSVRSRRGTDPSARTLGVVLVGDILVLTGLLYCSGGPSNPFSVMYLVNVTLAALVLGVRWAGAMVALSAVLYAALFFWHVPVPELSHAHHHMRGDRSGASPFSIHLQGMWVAFTVAASLIGYFVARGAGTLRAREADLGAARAASARTERLASLTTLAAGAAHELGTPLGTIAVAAKELERTIRESSDEALDDARLIRTEVERCRAIVQRMSAQAGETMGEIPRRATAKEIVRGGIERLRREAFAGVVVESGVEAAVLYPVEAAMQVLSSVIQNARWAVRDGGTVTVSWSPTPAGVALVVSDDGVGIAEKLLARIGEPFVTTKAPGEGMGLGVFLARTFAERSDGSLDLESVEGVGTKVMMTLPRAPEEARRG